MKKVYRFHTVNPAHTWFDDENKERGLNKLMNNLFETLGDGDGENGGCGSLWRCARYIYDALDNGNKYSYADCEWWIEELENEDDTEREYLFHMSAVVDTYAFITARSYEEAQEKYLDIKDERSVELKNAISNHGNPSWNYDGNINDEGDEVIH